MEEMNFEDLGLELICDSDLENIEGGILGTIGAAAGLAWLGYEAGYAFGKTIAHLQMR